MIDKDGSSYQWRSIDELSRLRSQSEYDISKSDGDNLLNEYFPNASELGGDGLSRRNFLSLMSASMALAGLAGCRRPVEKIIPYVIPPEEIIPGVPQYYATTMPFGLESFGVIVETHEGRPTKIEGNKNHPSTCGSANSYILSSILELYDPDRSRQVVQDGNFSDWSSFDNYWKTQFEKYLSLGGQGLAVISSAFNSPTLFRLRRQFLEKFPRAQWIAFEPVSDENIVRGVEAATKMPQMPEYDFERAKVILSLGCDFLHSEIGSIKNASKFARSRQPSLDADTMSRLYCIESGLTLTGAMADHRLALPLSDIADFLTAVIAELKNQGLDFSYKIPSRGQDLGVNHDFIKALASDLMANKGRVIICAGRSQPPWLHALVCALNHALNIGSDIITYRPLPYALTPDLAALNSLVKQMKDGQISTLVVFNANPVYSAPADLEFASALAAVPDKIHFGIYFDETAALSSWHLPAAHYLESWGDAASIEGILSVIQPMIEPLYGGRPDAAMANLLANGQVVSAHEIVRQTWQQLLNDSFETKWRKVLHDGYYAESILHPANPTIARIDDYLAANWKSTNDNSRRGLEIEFFPSSKVYDGRFANISWLQELPEPVTKTVWDNPARISKDLAANLNLQNGDMIAVDMGGAVIELPVIITPGIAEAVLAVELGYGRTSAGRVGDGVGFNTYRLRRSDGMYFSGGVAIAKTGKTHKLVTTQEHHTMAGRPIVRITELSHFRSNPEFASQAVEHPPLKSLWKEPELTGEYQWGMTIDLNACIGCGACTIACQSENNIPVVGKEGVGRGREMHWIRVDRYFEGEPNLPEVLFMPVPCQHCENAPCEQVCPVRATVHDSEGLNAMVYNRCVGTRYCSNNCPYKVRRFNFFNYTHKMPETLKMLQNPDVTVRSRGVMEKCTYCIQRINRSRIAAKIENRKIHDGEILTACQQACPTNAIVFGDISDTKSQVSKMKSDPRNYELLAELNNRPRTSYLARIKNPNPALVGKKALSDDHQSEKGNEG